MRFGHFEFTIMPFRLTNAPTVFKDLMNRVCKPYLDKFFIMFIDDILRYSKSKEDHEVHLKLVLELLKKEHLFAYKIEAMKNLKVPKTPFEKGEGGASKVENATAEMLRGLNQLMEMMEDGVMYFIWVPLISDVRTLMMDEAHASSSKAWSSGVDHLRLCWKIYFAILVDVGESIRNATRYEYGLSSSNRWTKSPILWAKIGEIRLIGPELEYWTDVNMHVPLEEIKVHKTLHFVEEPVEIIDREVKSLKRSSILIVKFDWDSKRDHEDFMRTSYSHLLIEQGIDGSTN
ncbi:putative reverse transcriptase domain-containing protein [Tanacetum coccineum]